MDAQLVFSDGYTDIWKADGALYVLYSVRDEYPAKLKEALARRRSCALEGVCPCAAKTGLGVGNVLTVDHAADCPVPYTEALLVAWKATR